MSPIREDLSITWEALVTSLIIVTLFIANRQSDNQMNDVKREHVIVSRQSKGRQSLWRKLIPSISTLLLIICFISTMIINGVVSPRSKRGFFCGDTSINYPVNTDTIGWKTLMLFAIVLPIIVIRVCDHHLKNSLERLFQSDRATDRKFVRHRKKGSDNGKENNNNNDNDHELTEEVEELATNQNNNNKRRLVLNSDADAEFEPVAAEDVDDEINNYVSGEELDLIDDEDVTLFTRIPLDEEKERQKNERIRLIRWVRYEYLQRKFSDAQIFIFGFITTMLFTGISKLTTGRLRPHFLQKCRPDIDCSLPMNANRYIENFVCTNVKPGSREMSYITTSFPSGHAAIMFYSMLYLSFYLSQVIPVIVHFGPRKLKQRYDPLILFAMNVLMVSLAIYISLTRVTDYHHHPTDVFTGIVVGSIVAICIFKSLTEKYFDKIKQTY